MATYISKGDIIDYTPSSAVAAGAVVVSGGIVGVATQAIAANATGTLAVSGVFEFPKASGALTLGATVYWDATNSNMTATATNNTLAGKVVEAAASAATAVKVKLFV